MRKKISIVLISLFVFTQIGFIKTKDNYVQAKESDLRVNDSKYGYRSIDYDVPKPESINKKSKSVLPSCYDSRTEGMISRVKNQGQYGTCWAFSAIANAEISAVKNGLTDNNVDLSESQLAYFFYNRINDPLRNTEGDRNINMTDSSFLDAGGNSILTTFTLGQWSGLVDEKKALYSDVNSDISLDSNLAYNENSYVMKDGYFINGTTQDDLIHSIKETLLEKGSLNATYYASDVYALETFYYVKDGLLTNHLITIVGYDDSIDKSIFKGNTPTKDGAWIVKNSWGSNYGDNGYFYLSYDQFISNIVAYNYTKADSYNHNYFYDGSSGVHEIVSNNGDKFSVASIFKAKGDNELTGEALKAVSIGIASADTKYKVHIFTDLKDPTDPTSGKEISFSQPVEGIKKFAGMYTIDLPETVQVSKGDLFSVVVDLENIGGNTSCYVASNVDYGWFTTNENIEEGQTFASTEDGWIDLYSINVTARVRAITNDMNEPSIHLNLADIKVNDIKYTGVDLKPEVIVKYKDTVLIEDTDYKLTYKDNSSVGISVVEITGIGKYSGTITKDFSILKGDISLLSLPNINEQIYSGSELTPKIELINGGYTLIEGLDYTISYTNNIEPGIATITITGINNYSGTFSKTFKISKPVINEINQVQVSQDKESDVDTGDKTKVNFYALIFTLAGALVITLKKK